MVMEKKLISFRSLKNICVYSYPGDRYSYHNEKSNINYCSKYDRIITEENEKRCNEKNCPMWKRLIYPVSYTIKKKRKKNNGDDSK
jgi:hypothetical protein